jgi:hypothetical protein
MAENTKAEIIEELLNGVEPLDLLKEVAQIIVEKGTNPVYMSEELYYSTPRDEDDPSKGYVEITYLDMLLAIGPEGKDEH